MLICMTLDIQKLKKKGKQLNGLEAILANLDQNQSINGAVEAMKVRGVKIEDVPGLKKYATLSPAAHKQSVSQGLGITSAEAYETFDEHWDVYIEALGSGDEARSAVVGVLSGLKPEKLKRQKADINKAHKKYVDTAKAASDHRTYFESRNQKVFAKAPEFQDVARMLAATSPEITRFAAQEDVLKAQTELYEALEDGAVAIEYLKAYYEQATEDEAWSAVATGVARQLAA